MKSHSPSRDTIQRFKFCGKRGRARPSKQHEPPPTQLITLLGLCLLAVMPVQADLLRHQWCRYQLGAWEIITDLPESRIPALLIGMHDTAEVFAHLYGQPEPLVNQPVEIWAFRERSDFRRVLGEGHISGLTVPRLDRIRLIFGPIDGVSSSKGLLQNARHEYTHYLQRMTLPSLLPRWQEEGQATLLGNLSWNKKAGVVEFGAVPGLAEPLNRARARRLLNADSVVGWPAARLRQFYQLAHIVALEQMKVPRSPHSSNKQQLDLPFGLWRNVSATSGQSEPRLRLPSRGSLHNGRRSIRFRALAPKTELPHEGRPVKTQCLSSNGLRQALSEVIATLNPPIAEQFLGAIPVQKRQQPQWSIQQSRTLAALKNMSQSRVVAEQAYARFPDSAEVAIQLANAHVGHCLVSPEEDCLNRWQSAEQLYRKALKRRPDRYDGIYGLGLARLHTGLAGDGLNYLRIAYQKAPWSPQVNFYLGEAYRLLGNPRAEQHLQTAFAWFHEPLWRARAQAALDLLQDTGTAEK